jgi:hypothetical protein
MIEIVKADGQKESFDEIKLRQSLIKAGASENAVEQVVQQVVPALRSGMSTEEVYRLAFQALHHTEKKAAARYSLKRAVLDFGPSGFPFEKFVAEIFKSQGYETKVDQMLQGSCVEHEVDVVADNQKDFIVCEAKFHNSLSLKSDLKVALYVSARMEDLRNSPACGEKAPRMRGVLVTNTTFTENAVKYSECVGLNLISWDYPVKGNLHDLISGAGLHPLTCLSTLTKDEKNRFLEKGVVLCNDLRKDHSLLEAEGIKDGRLEEVVNESNNLCQPFAVN